MLLYHQTCFDLMSALSTQNIVLHLLGINITSHCTTHAKNFMPIN